MGTQLLDAAIGVIFVILTFSLVASALKEALAGVLNWRGRVLRRGLFRLLEGAKGADLVNLPFLSRARIKTAELTLDVLSDPAIRVLHGPRSLIGRIWDRLMHQYRSDIERAVAGLGRLPSAIPPESFARALVDTLVRRIDLSAVRPGDGLTAENVGAAGAALRQLAEDLSAEADRVLRATDGVLAAIPLDPAMTEQVRASVRKLSVAREIGTRLDQIEEAGAEAREEVDRLLREAEDGLQRVLEGLGAWFERSMDRVSGWYARRARVVLFVLGVGLAGAVNIDLSTLGQRVLSDEGLRRELVLQAEERLSAGLPAGRPRPEDAATGDAAADAVIREVRRSNAVITALPGTGGPGFGRACGVGETWLACAWRSLSLSALLSWVLIGLGSMMGGQFWYNLLGVVLRFRPVAVGTRKPA